MKKLRITVRGISYEVLVDVIEDTDDYSGDPLPAGVGRGRRRPAAASPAAPATAPAAGPLPQTPAAVDPDTIAAPIAGTVQKVFVVAGGEIEAKAPVVLLDAMKMDTYIYAPRKGRIREVAIQPGQTVQIGAPLIRYEPEGKA
jgi:biotin carboxyl carrier protein